MLIVFAEFATSVFFFLSIHLDTDDWNVVFGINPSIANFVNKYFSLKQIISTYGFKYSKSNNNSYKVSSSHIYLITVIFCTEIHSFGFSFCFMAYQPLWVAKSISTFMVAKAIIVEEQQRYYSI